MAQRILISPATRGVASVEALRDLVGYVPGKGRVVELVGGPGRGKTTLGFLVLRACVWDPVLLPAAPVIAGASYGLDPSARAARVGLPSVILKSRPEGAGRSVFWDAGDPADHGAGPLATRETASSARVRSVVQEAREGGHLLVVSNALRFPMDTNTARMPPILREEADLVLRVMGAETRLRGESGRERLTGDLRFDLLRRRVENEVLVPPEPIRFSVDVQTLLITSLDGED